MFTHAIVRTPGRSLVQGISSSNLGKPDYENALKQHAGYIGALQRCGVAVTVLPAEEQFPDSTFIEDTAIVTPTCAIIAHPGASSRQGEEVSVKASLTAFYKNIEQIQSPGTLDGGDVMMVGTHFYIGVSARTNAEGARQLIHALEKYGYSGSMVEFSEMLHLKTGLAYLERNTLLIAGEFVNNQIFTSFNKIVIDAGESYAANCIWVNDTVLVPAGFPKTQAAIERAGYAVITVDVSEFRKLDGGLSCLSLRF